MERSLTEKEKEKIVNFGAFGYSDESCAVVLGWDIKEVADLQKNKNSEFAKTYRNGQIKADYVIDLKLFEQAQAGDIKSLDKLELRKRQRK